MNLDWWRHRRFWLLVAGGVLLAVVGSQLPLEQGFTAVKDWLASLGPLALPGFVLIYLLATILGLPNIVLILVAGSLFGLGLGIVAASVADTLGARCIPTWVPLAPPCSTRRSRDRRWHCRQWV